MINIQHVTLNDTTNSAKLCMSIGAKLVFVKKDMTQRTVIGCLCNKQ